MKEKLKNKNVFIILIILLIVAIISIGTYALSTWISSENTELTIRIGNYADVIFETGDDVNITNIGPVFDYETDGEDKEFYISNLTSNNITANVNLNITTISEEFKEESFKYIFLSSNDGVTYEKELEGNFSTITDGTTINLITGDEFSEKVYYKIIFYIDGNVNNPIDIQNGSLTGYISTEANVAANAPELTDNLIPVYYDESVGTWKTTSSKNEDTKWYNYEDKKWANAVLLTETKRAEVLDDSGNIISDVTIGDTEADGTLAFYVWIPRYKYRVWNINKTIGVDSYDAQNQGIDIVFENSQETTGTINCNYRFDVTATETIRNEECTGANGEYYTHPAFTFGDDELTGFWMGKFELSSDDGTTENSGGGNSTELKPRVLPNALSWRINYIDYYWRVIYNMNTEDGNEYGLNADKTKVDSRIITGLDWGAVSYLTNSKYGRCSNGVCEEVSINNSGAIDSSTSLGFAYTGRSGATVSENTTFNVCGTYAYDGKNVTDGSETGTCVIDESSYSNDNIQNGTLASTTGNIYGVYDMAGGTDEYVMSNLGMSTTAGTSYTYNPGYSANDSNVFQYTGFEKYLVPYAYGTSNTDQVAYNRARLGDAVAEVILEGGKAWYDDRNSIVSSNTVFAYRGGSFYTIGKTGWNGGIFLSAATTGRYSGYHTTRAVLVVFPDETE